MSSTYSSFIKQYGGATNTITTSSFTPASGACAVGIVQHVQTGITNTGVSNSVDGAFTSAGTRGTNGSAVITMWQLQSISASSMTASATFSANWGTSSCLTVVVVTSAHASSAFTGYATAGGTNDLPAATASTFTTGDLTVGGFIGGGGGTCVATGSTTNLYVDSTGLQSAAGYSTSSTVGHDVQFSGTWVAGVITVVQAAGGGSTGTIAVTLANFTSAISGAATTVGSMAQTLGSFTSTMSGLLPQTGTMEAVLGAFTSAMAGTKTIVGTIANTLGSFSSSMYGSVSGGIAAGRWLVRQIANSIHVALHRLNGVVRRNRNNQ